MSDASKTPRTDAISYPKCFALISGGKDFMSNIYGLATPWKWIQPSGSVEIKQRLLEARDFNVHERERENMCSVAHGHIVYLELELTALREELEAIRARLAEAEKDAQRYRWLADNVENLPYPDQWRGREWLDATIDAARSREWT